MTTEREDGRVTVRLPTELRSELDKFGKQQFMNLSQYIRLVLINHVINKRKGKAKNAS